MTPETAVTAPAATTPSRVDEAAQPRLADRLSALVGQAASRQEDSVSAERLVSAIAARVDAATAELRERIAVVEAGQAARMTELESLVGDRLKAIEAALGSPSEDAGMKSHVDEVGGAIVLRLDEVLAGLAQQVEELQSRLLAHADQTRATLAEHAETVSGGAAESGAAFTAQLDAARHQLAVQLEEARGQLATAVTESQLHLSGQAEASRVTIEEFEQTLLSHIGDLAGGIVELGDKSGLTHEDLETAVAGVAQAAQLDGVTATTTALREELDDVVVALGEMRAEFNGLQAAIEKRVDDAALALAETLVAVITSMPAVQSAPSISYDFDDFAEPTFVEEPLAESVEAQVDEPAEEPVDGDLEAPVEEATPDHDGLSELESAFNQGEHPEHDDPAVRRKGIFRR